MGMYLSVWFHGKRRLRDAMGSLASPPPEKKVEVVVVVKVTRAVF